MIRKSATRPIISSATTTNAADNDNSVGGGIHWCNASATSQGTFGSAVGGASTVFIGESPQSLATYSKKDIALTKRTRRQQQQQQQIQQQCREYETTCVRAQVWDVNVPQSEISSNNHHNDNYSSWNGNFSKNDSFVNSTSSITSSSPQQYNHPENIPSPLLPLLNRINGIILTCPCPSPPSFPSSSIPTTPLSISSQTFNNDNDGCNSISNNSVKSNVQNHNNGCCNGSYNGTSGVEWQELEVLEEQIARWMKFIHGHVGLNGDANSTNNNGGKNSSNSKNNSNNNKHPYKIFLMLTFADLAITHYSPNEWMKLSLKLEEICVKFGIYSWRMGTCVDSRGDNGAMDNSHLKQQQQQQQYGIFQQMARQQQQMMEEMEDSVEALFIDMILLYLDG